VHLVAAGFHERRDVLLALLAVRGKHPDPAVDVQCVQRRRDRGAGVHELQGRIEPLAQPALDRLARVGIAIDGLDRDSELRATWVACCGAPSASR